jgi:polygalacturonase
MVMLEQNVLEHGAKGDGIHYDTAVLQRVLDSCAGTGETVFFPAGKYLTGTLFLRNNTNIHLAAGAEILGGRSLDDYFPDLEGHVEFPEGRKCLLYGQDAENIVITGTGRINGQGIALLKRRKETVRSGERPMLIRLVRCRNIVFRDITLTDSAAWCCHFVECSLIKIQGIYMPNYFSPNNDGFDFDGCRDVFMSDCRIRSKDDSICLKSTRQGCENFVITNCILESATGAVKLGTSSRGGFKNVAISNCIFTDCLLGALKILLVDGGICEDISVRNIIMKNVDGPFFIRLGKRGRTYHKPRRMEYGDPAAEEGKMPPGTLRRVSITGIQAVVTGSKKDRSGILVTGIPGGQIEDLILRDISVSCPGGGTEADAGVAVPEDEARYPEQHFFGILPAWGLYLRHVRRFSITNVTLYTRTPDGRPAAVFLDAEEGELVMNNFEPEYRQ